jgi:spoIIIJ-associated protein
MEMSGDKRKINEIAGEVLEELLRLMELKATVVPSDEFTVTDEEGNAASIGLNIVGDDLGILIGRRGQTLASLQQIVRLIVSRRTETRLPIVLDVEGYKQRRCEGLRVLANRLADQVKSRKVPFTMEPMPAFERRVIHLELAGHPDVYTESTGVGDARKVVISPKKNPVDFHTPDVLT